jgi:hypothetical protein
VRLNGVKSNLVGVSLERGRRGDGTADGELRDAVMV